MAIFLPLSRSRHDWLTLCIFVLLYVFLDWISYIQPLFGLNITPWNPDPALSIVIWLRFGWRAALPSYAALVLSELWVRGMPAGLPLTLLLSGQLLLGYGAIGEVLRRRLAASEHVSAGTRLAAWIAVISVGLLLNGALYVGMLAITGLIPAAALWGAAARFVIGDVFGVVVAMPLIWLLASDEGRRAVAAVLRSWEAAAYFVLATLLVWGVFRGLIGSDEFKHFYLLFLPVIWAATRHGMPGAALVAFVLQLGIVMIIRVDQAHIPFAELQLLGAALALVGFFIGVMVDEQRRTAEGLKQSLRLAAAGEMAAALAHELNQPMTALAAYGKACEHLLARGEKGDLLAESIGKMVREAGRASEVVRRLREFFRTGAMHLETASVSDIIGTVTAQFAQQCRDRDVTLAVESEPDLWVRADKLQIELVLRNLVANALDAVQGQREQCVTVSAESLRGNRLRITVRDNGAGVSTAAATRLFAPFVSGKSSGLGLGLVLSRAIIEAHGGKIWADIGEQGMFNFTLPLWQTGEQLEQ